MNPALKHVLAAIRRQHAQRDDAGHFLREVAFDLWCQNTVFPQAVNRLIAQIGERANEPD